MRNATLLSLALLCAACSNYSPNLPSIKPYRMDVQQGNVVTSKMMLQLRPGMTRSQVRFIMGTPLIVDSFHANRWDYVYRMQKDGKVIEQRHVILEFEGDQLKRVRGDVIPADSNAAAPAEPGMEPKKLEPKKKEEKGLLDKLKFWKSDEEKAAPKTEAKPESAPAAAPVQKPAAQPEPEQPKPAAAGRMPETQAEPKPVPAEMEPAPPAVPAPKAEPAPAAAAQPAAKPVEPPKTELKAAPKPADDLPPEGDPGYFERMLEKIGF